MFMSGLSALDEALFAGNGVPPGSLIELHGTEDSGKTGLALWFCRTYEQQTGNPIAWISTEPTISKRNMKWAGVDPENAIIITQSPDMPGLTAVQLCLQEGFKVVVIDSIAALIDSSIDTPLTQILSAELYKVKCLALENEALVLLTNQERCRVPGRGMTRSGACAALNRLVDCQIRLQSGQGLYRGGVQEGVRIYFTITKNGLDFSRWDQAGRINLYYERGFVDMRKRERNAAA